MRAPTPARDDVPDSGGPTSGPTSGAARAAAPRRARRYAPRLVGVLVVLLVAAATGGGLLAPAGAGAADLPSLSGVSLQVEVNQVRIAGAVAFSAATAPGVWADPTGDARYAGVGADAGEASVRLDGADVVFRLAIADPLPDPVFTLPEVVHYHWSLTVTAGGKTTPYLIQGMRSGQYNRPAPSPTPLLRVLACSSLASGAASCFTHLAEVPGAMAAGVVEWRVPAALIGVSPAASLSTFGNGVIIQPGASGAAYASGGLTTLDQVSTQRWFAGPALGVALVPAGLDPEETGYEAVPPAADGTFTAALATTGVFPGDYEVVVRACQAVSCDEVRLPYSKAWGD